MNDKPYPINPDASANGSTITVIIPFPATTTASP